MTMQHMRLDIGQDGIALSLSSGSCAKRMHSTSSPRARL